jgi:hypothetical protein
MRDVQVAQQQDQLQNTWQQRATATWKHSLVCKLLLEFRSSPRKTKLMKTEWVTHPPISHQMWQSYSDSLSFVEYINNKTKASYQTNIIPKQSFCKLNNFLTIFDEFVVFCANHMTVLKAETELRRKPMSQQCSLDGRNKSTNRRFGFFLCLLHPQWRLKWSFETLRVFFIADRSDNTLTTRFLTSIMKCIVPGVNLKGLAFVFLLCLVLFQ